MEAIAIPVHLEFLQKLVLKKFFTLLIPVIFLLSPLYAFPQDGWINQAKQINTGLYDMFYFSAPPWDYEQYWMVGDSGTILNSARYHQSWALQECNTVADLRGVYFFPNGTGFCVGEQGTCIRSRNYGNQWESIALYLTSDLNDIWFINDTAGIIVGDSGTFLISMNAGMDWNAVDLAVTSNMNKIRQLTGSLTWIVGDSGTVFKTVNAGEDWQKINTGYTNDFNDIYLADNVCIYIVGDSGLVIKSENDGVTWLDMSVPDTSDLQGVGCTNCFNVWVCGDHGSLYFRTATDTAWHTYLGSTRGLDYHSLLYLPEDFDFLFPADSGYYITVHNFGTSGSIYKAGDNLDYRVVDFVDSMTGFIGGNCLMHTVDGGTHWYSLHPGEFSSFLDRNSLDFIDQQRGWITGYGFDDGLKSWILKTDDGGFTWTQKYFSEDLQLSCIHFLDPDHGWAGGDGGYMVRTDDGGENWNVIQPLSSGLGKIQKIFFYTQAEGYITRNYGDFLTTHNGGDSWQLTMDFAGITDYNVIQDSIIYVLSNSLGVYKSSDKGHSWTFRDFPFYNQTVTSMYFNDEFEGWICGTYGSLWHTIDGGENWVFENETGLDEDYQVITFTDIFHGWLLGQSGSIMHGPGLFAGVPENRDSLRHDLLIYPNPAKTKININFQEYDINPAHSLSIYNIISQEMTKIEIQDGFGSVTAEVSGYQPGIYMVLLKEGEKIITSGKFIVLPVN